MFTMKPVIIHGRTVWDQGYFPPDECSTRLHLVQDEISRRRLQGLVAFGNCADYGNLYYLTQFIPMTHWPAMVVVPAEGSVTLVPNVGGGRDIAVARTRSCVQDVRAIKTLGPGLREVLSERGITTSVGVAGLEWLPTSAHDQVVTALKDLDPVPADDLMAGIRVSLRPREISAVRAAARIVQAAAAEAAKAHADGASNAAAIVEADGAARRLGAHDFRSLAVLDESGEMAPFEQLGSFRSEPLVAYFAASFLGYWADLGITVGGTPTSLLAEATEALRGMVAYVRAGVRTADLVLQAKNRLGTIGLNHALRYGLGNGVGLTLSAAPRLTPDSEEILTEDSVLTLRIRLGTAAGPGVLVSDLVLVTAGGSASLLEA